MEQCRIAREVTEFGAIHGALPSLTRAAESVRGAAKRSQRPRGQGAQAPGQEGRGRRGSCCVERLDAECPNRREGTHPQGRRCQGCRSGDPGDEEAGVGTAPATGARLQGMPNRRVALRPYSGCSEFAFSMRPSGGKGRAQRAEKILRVRIGKGRRVDPGSEPEPVEVPELRPGLVPQSSVWGQTATRLLAMPERL